MTSENEPPSNQPELPESPDEIPLIEDAYEVGEPSADAVAEDDPEFLAPTARSLEAEAVESEAAEAEAVETFPAVAAKAAADDTTDAGTLPDEPELAGAADAEATEPDWANELSAQRIAVELKHIEVRIRRLLEDRDPRRKRKLGGTRRWLELEEDIINWRHTGRFDEATLVRISELVAQRHYLFRRLRFITSTRPVWNT